MRLDGIDIHILTASANQNTESSLYYAYIHSNRYSRYECLQALLIDTSTIVKGSAGLANITLNKLFE